MNDFRETLYTIDSKGRRKWVYPTIVSGAFRKWRRFVISLLLANYVFLPWIVIGGDQAVRLDIVNRRFTLFGSTFHATETFYLFLILGALGFSLFLFTALFGRVWCGWACPQTVFLEFVFRPIERLIEGDAVKRRRLDDAPWTARKLGKKASKVFLFGVVSWFLASTFLAYFVGRNELIVMMGQSPSHNPSLFIATLAMMALIMFEFGWFREQFCTVLCPYARFQSVLLDRDSLAVSYDTERGEPRGKKGAAGDCVDCGLCVRVCPTGIDIRNGLQLECVQCTACIDACDSIMQKTSKPKGLIRYTTERALSGGQIKILRPRVFAYGALVALYLITLSIALRERSEGEFRVVRVKGDAPFAEVTEGILSNQFRVHLVNNSKETGLYTIQVVDALDVKAIVPLSPFPVAPSQESDVPLFLQFSKSRLTRGTGAVDVEVFANAVSLGKQTVPLIGPDA